MHAIAYELQGHEIRLGAILLGVRVPGLRANHRALSYERNPR